jgi:hypothetical protein
VVAQAWSTPDSTSQVCSSSAWPANALGRLSRDFIPRRLVNILINKLLSSFSPALVFLQIDVRHRKNRLEVVALSPQTRLCRVNWSDFREASDRRSLSLLTKLSRWEESVAYRLRFAGSSSKVGPHTAKTPMLNMSARSSFCLDGTARLRDFGPDHASSGKMGCVSELISAKVGLEFPDASRSLDACAVWKLRFAV